MTEEERSIEATDGYELAATVFDGGSISKVHIIIVASATGVKRKYYAAFASFMARQGFQVVTFDYRGIGDSLREPIHTFNARMSDWGNKDLSGVIAWARKQFPKARLTVVAHSVGGQILPLSPNRRLVDSIILVGCQSGYWKHWPLPNRHALLLLWTIVMPVLTFIRGYMPCKLIGLGENLPKGVAREWGRWCRHKDYVARDEPGLIHAQFASMDVPLLAYSFWDDTIAPQPAVDELVSWYTNAKITRRHIQSSDIEYDGIGHFGFFREHHKLMMWEIGVLAWLKKLPRVEREP